MTPAALSSFSLCVLAPLRGKMSHAKAPRRKEGTKAVYVLSGILCCEFVVF